MYCNFYFLMKSRGVMGDSLRFEMIHLTKSTCEVLFAETTNSLMYVGSTQNRAPVSCSHASAGL